MGSRALFVASSGGHLDELAQLRPRLVPADADVTWVTFDTPHSRSLLSGEQRVIYLRPIGPRSYLALLRAIVPALRILCRIRPREVYSTGAAIALAFLPLAALVGARGIYIESAARITGPSQTGRLLALLPWVRLRTQYYSWTSRTWKYGGSVFDGLESHRTGSVRPVRRVVVTLGTQVRFPFVALVQRIREIAPADVEIRWQVGAGFPAAHRPEGAVDLLPAAELRDWIEWADTVIAHGGVGSALSVLRSGHRPVLVPRRSARNEHVDDHQAQLVDELVHRDLATGVEVGDLTWADVVAATSARVRPSAPAAARRTTDAEPAVGVHVEDVAPASAAGGARRAGRRTLVAATAAAAVVGSVATGSLVNSADAVGSGYEQSTVVSAVPSTITPNITNGIVYAVTQVGSTIVVGGSFTTVQNARSTTTVTRTRVLAFDATTGALTASFAPTLDNTVEALQPGPTPGTVYVGGLFTTVNGVKSKGITLLNLSDGSIASGFKPPALNGAVYTIATVPGHVLLGGTFTLAGASTRNGLLSLWPQSGTLDSYLTAATLGHHNYNGSGANGPVGPRAMAVSPDGSRLFVLGNFTSVAGVARDQAAMIDLGYSSATVDPTWATLGFTARCASGAFDTYVTDVQWAPDGSYFAITATGGGDVTYNTDGTRSLCDSATRWSATDSGADVQPTWIDRTGNDTLWSVAVTGAAIYVGGHQRWLNNYYGTDNANAGSVPRPGVAALDPANGLPLSWNPGRNPRGAGAYALFVGSAGLYVGSDTDWIGNFAYKRQKIAFFPLAGGVAPASTSIAALPADVFVGGAAAPDNGQTSSGLFYRADDGSRVGPSTSASSVGTDWSQVRGAFAVGSTLFYASSSGYFVKAPITGQSIGTPTAVNPYVDPAWDNVQTGSHQTYLGVVPDYYQLLPNVTGAFYLGGRMYYTVAGQTTMFSRAFTPDSGIIGDVATSSSTFDFSQAIGIFYSNGFVYWADAADGTLHQVAFANGAAVAGTDTVVGGPAIDGHDWRAWNLFLSGPATFPDLPPTASATTSCSALDCSFDGTGSTDPDGSVASYAWDFGDGTTGTGATATHGYAQPGTYPVSLVVTDNQGAASTAWTGSVTVSAPAAAISFVGQNDTNSLTAAPSVTVPLGTQAGDTELLYVSTGTNGVTTAPAGWTQLVRGTNAPTETTVYTRTAAAADAGSAVQVALTSSVRVDLQLVVYRGVSAVAATTSGDTNTATHVAPAITPSAGGSWVVSFWSSRSSGTAVWTLPTGLRLRGTGLGSGGGHVDTGVGDVGPVSTVTYSPLTASSGIAGGKGEMVTIALAPTA